MQRLARVLVLILLVVPLVVFLALVTVPPQGQLDLLAKSGKIDESAPVKTSVSITINAPPEKVWALLADVKGWPKWQPDITAADISGQVALGTPFTWTTGGSDIHSTVMLLQPGERLGWTGTAYQAKAIHVWTLQRLAADRTLVRTDESMDGFLLKLFFSSDKLKSNDERWLEDLKAAAER